MCNIMTAVSTWIDEHPVGALGAPKWLYAGPRISGYEYSSLQKYIF